MLSSQTKDTVTHQAVKNLRENLDGGLTLESLLAASPEEIDSCIGKVGFHNIKTKNLAKLAIRLRDQHDGEVPDDLRPSLFIAKTHLQVLAR
jgi:endonuclease-3